MSRENPVRVLTIQELVDLCERIKCPYREAIEIGKSIGIAEQYVQRLRTLLGYANGLDSYKLTRLQRDEIARDYEEEQKPIAHYAAKYGISTNAVISLLKSRGVYEGDPRKWSNIKVMRLRVLYERGAPIKDISLQVGKSTDACRSYIQRHILGKPRNDVKGTRVKKSA